MITIKKTALILLIALSTGAFSMSASAKDASKTAVHGPNQAIMHIEKAKVEIMHNDFVPPSEHLKAARAESEKITGKPAITKKATAALIQAQIKVKEGDKKGATAEMNKVLELYKSIKPE